MGIVSSVPAAERARRAAIVAVVAGVVVPLGCWLAVTAPRRGLLVAFVALVVVHASIRRRQDLAVLAALGNRRVGEVAQPVPVLRPHGSSSAIDELRRIAGYEVAVVPTDAGWRVLHHGDVADAVLRAASGGFGGDWTRYLRRAPTVDSDVPVARLRRVPDAGEQWLVRGDVGAPRVISAGTLHGAARRSAATRSATSAAPDGGTPAPEVELRA